MYICICIYKYISDHVTGHLLPLDAFATFELVGSLETPRQVFDRGFVARTAAVDAAKACTCPARRRTSSPWVARRGVCPPLHRTRRSFCVSFCAPGGPPVRCEVNLSGRKSLVFLRFIAFIPDLTGGPGENSAKHVVTWRTAGGRGGGRCCCSRRRRGRISTVIIRNVDGGGVRGRVGRLGLVVVVADQDLVRWVGCGSPSRIKFSVRGSCRSLGRRLP